jgi:hypothetical protein
LRWGMNKMWRLVGHPTLKDRWGGELQNLKRRPSSQQPSRRRT